ncbi:hypothetical protein ABEB36_002419 [Hypothenemus hampei]|uniref:Uncharacterized protein n=1 Tax=Hypothenemus hampei TaxID=57062 RepID=A0ABD1F5P7_HYPHA
MKLILCSFITFLFISAVKGTPFWDKLFNGYETSYNYGQSYGSYPRTRSYGRSYGHDGGDGGERYKSICRVHAASSLAFPGRVGNPVCP